MACISMYVHTHAHTHANVYSKYIYCIHIQSGRYETKALRPQLDTGNWKCT